MKQSNKSAYILTAVSVLCSGAALALYLTGGTNKLCPEMKPACTAALMVAIVLGIAGLVTGIIRHRKPPMLLCYAQYLAALVGFGEYIVSQLNYIANVFYGVDGNAFTAVQISTALTALVAFVLALVWAGGARRAKFGMTGEDK